jgi:hypothetical protein
LQPPELTLRFALFAADGLRAVALMTQVALVGTIKLFAAKVFAPDGTLHWPTQKNLNCPCCETLPQSSSMPETSGQNRTSQNKTKKVLHEVEEQKITGHYPVFKPAVTQQKFSANRNTKLCWWGKITWKALRKYPPRGYCLLY